MGQAQSSKFLADIDFSKPSVEDIHQIMEYFHASKEPGKEECLDSTQARRFLSKLCKYQHIPAHRSANFVDYLMDRLDKNKDNQLSFEELSDQELWKDVFKLVAGAKTDSEDIWTEKLKGKSEEKCAAPPLTSLDTAFAAAALSPVGAKASILGPEDKAADDFWVGIEGADTIDYVTLVTGLSEAWDCSGGLAQTITELLLPPTPKDGGQIVKRREFNRFIRAFGPWGEGPDNVLIRFILLNFFEADRVTPRRVFHANIDEKKSRSLLKNRGDFLYRYSSHYPNGINITRVSTNANNHVAEPLQNTRNGTWLHDGTTYASLREFETALKAKLLTPIMWGSATSTAAQNHYSSSLANAEAPTAASPVNHYSSSLNSSKSVGSPRSDSPTRSSIAGEPQKPASPPSTNLYSNSLTPQNKEAHASPDPYYAKGMSVAK